MTADNRTEAKFRVEEDALGNVEVPADHLWGAQTQRSHLNFPIGVERYRWGRPVIRAFGILKKCAALANGELGQLPREKVDLIVRAAEEVIDGKLDGEFPLVVFQTGSGTQPNMNANDVIMPREDQPDPVRDPDHGGGAGVRQRPRGGLRRFARELSAQRLQAGHPAQRTGVDPTACRGDPIVQ
jgi:hypothetical protein